MKASALQVLLVLQISYRKIVNFKVRISQSKVMDCHL